MLEYFVRQDLAGGYLYQFITVSRELFLVSSSRVSIRRPRDSGRGVSVTGEFPKNYKSVVLCVSIFTAQAHGSGAIIRGSSTIMCPTCSFCIDVFLY